MVKRILAYLCLALVAAVGLLAGRALSGNTPGDDGPGEPPDLSTLSPSDRLGWDQTIFADTDPRAYRFAAYVDGVRQALSDVSCTDGPPLATCTSSFPRMGPGRHAIELVAVVGGEESDRSEPLTVVQNDVNTLNRTLAAPSQAAGAALASTAIATGLVAPRDMALSPDGRFFVAEEAGHVRISDGRGAAVTALTLDDVDARPGRGLMSLALPADFAETHYVFLAYVRRQADGRSWYRIIRTREVGDRLGEAITVLDQVPVEAPAGIRIRIGPDNKVYAAIAPLASGTRNAAGAYNGALLRLNIDGSTPNDNPRGAPVLTDGVGTPAALAWAADNTLWLAQVRNGAPELVRIGGRAFPLPRATMPVALAVQPADGGTTLLLTHHDGSGVERFQVAGAGTSVESVTPFAVDQGRLGCLAAYRDALYACTDNGPDVGSTGDWIVRVATR